MIYKIKASLSLSCYTYTVLAKMEPKCVSLLTVSLTDFHLHFFLVFTHKMEKLWILLQDLCASTLLEEYKGDREVSL